MTTPYYEQLSRDVLALARERRTGVLEVRGPELASDLYFSRGVLVFVEGGTVSDTLGRILLREGLLTEPQYAAIIAAMTTRLVDSEARRFGEVAVELGFLAPQQIHDALARQVRRKFLQCFRWSTAGWSFFEDPDCIGEIAAFPSPTGPLVLEALRGMIDPVRAEDVLAPRMEMRIGLAAPLEAIKAELGLHPSEAEFLTAADGHTLAELLRRSTALDAVHTRVLVASMSVLGLIRERAPEAAARQPSPVRSEAAPGRALSTQATSLAAARMRARQLLAAARSASGTRREWLRDSASVALDSLQRIRKAGPPSPMEVVPSDPGQAQLMGEQAFQAGCRHVRYGAWPLAIKEFAHACECVPDALEYQLHLAWAQLSGGDPDPVARREELDRLSIAVLKQDNESGFAHYIRGQLALVAGDEAQAARAFKVAARLDPSNVDAVRHLRILSRRRE